MRIAAVNPVNAFTDFAAHNDLTAGAWVIGLFFAFWSWVGFEMAPNYGEESRDPKRIVPLSLYISVLGLGIFYTITSWAGVSAYSTIDDAIKISQTDSAHFFLTPANSMVGAWVGGLMSYLILTGAFACGMAFHNTAARYFYSLGREGVLPRSLGRLTLSTKGRMWRRSRSRSSPRSSSSCSGSLPAAMTRCASYVMVYGLLAVMGTMLIMLAQALVSIAIIVYFRKNHPEDHHW